MPFGPGGRLSVEKMRYYLIDEISTPDMEKLRNHLTDKAIRSGLDDIYWVEFPEDILTGTQSQHDLCKPYVFALELGENHLKAELFVRNRNHFGCSCQGYCHDRQSSYVIVSVLNMIDELNIRT